MKYINETMSIRCGINKAYMPFSRIKDGSFDGLSVEIVRNIEEKFGVKIEFVLVKNKREALNYLEKGKIDFYGTGVVYLNEKIEGFNFSNPISTFGHSILSTKDYPDPKLSDFVEKKVGYKSGLPFINNLKEQYKNISFVEIPISYSGYQRLKKKEIYAYLDTNPVVTFYKRKHQSENFSIGHLNRKYQSLVFITHESKDPALLRLLNNFLNNMTSIEKYALVDKWYSIQVEEITDYTMVWMLASFTGVLVLFFIYWNGRLSKLNLVIQEKELLARSLLESTNAIPYHYNPLNDHFEYIAPQIVSETGYSPDELIRSEHWLKHIYHDDVNNFESQKDIGIKNKKNFTLEYRFVTKKGAYLWFRDLITPVIENGEVIALKGLLLNVSHEKKQELEIKAAKEAAESANQAKSQFLANMSHEIRTPLNPIIGLTHVALTTNASFPQVKDYLSKIQASSKSLLRIINDILDLSKMEADKLNLENIPFDLNQLNERINSLYGVKAHEKKIDLLFEIDSNTHPYVMGDPLRMEQIIGNLVSNAIKFTDSGHVKVVIKTLEEHDRSQSLFFGISDTGLGIPEDKLDKIFEVFTQADDSNTRTHGGTGLGLNICKKLIHIMGGELNAKSQEGKGSEFYFNITLNKVTQSDFLEYQKNSFDKHNIPKFKASKILLAEDNPINKQVADELLKAVNLKAIHVNNGQECIDAVLNEDFDIVLTDIQMPVMDGLEATRVIRSYDKYKKLPIIAMTAQAFGSEKKVAYEAGVNDHVTKPIDPINLYETLAKYLTIEEFVQEIDQHHEQVKSIDSNILDVESGIRRVRGNAEIYSKIILDFQNMHDDFVSQLKSDIHQNLLKNAQLKLHQIKGAAANIGAIKLHQISNELENELYSNKNNQRDLRNFVTTFDETIKNIKDFSEMLNVQPEEHTKQYNQDKSELYHKLKEQILNASPEALSTLEQLIKQADSASIDLLKKIQSDLKDFNFESAAKKITNLRILI